MRIVPALLMAAAFGAPAFARDFDSPAGLRKAAEAGNAEAQRKLGFMYYDGKGVKQDIVQGVAWFERAAAGGDLESQSNLCVMYEMALFVDQDYGRAAGWCARAAAQGDPPSQFRLGELTYLGRGLPRDVVEASKWWEILRLTLPEERLAGLRRTVEMAEAKLSAAQLAEARARAERWVATHPAARR